VTVTNAAIDGVRRARRNNPVTNEWDFVDLIRPNRVVAALAEPLPLSQIVRGAGRNRASVAISFAIVTIAVAALYHLLRGIDLGKFLAALEAQSPLRILIAGALVVAGYANLICYDLFALHTIGKDKIPLRVVAFTSFTSYTIGHSLGAATLTCGLVRFRVYSFWKLDVVDIAKIAFVTGLTFWLGNLTVLGLGLAYVPAAASAVDHLPASANRTVGITALCIILSYVIYVWRQPRIVGAERWQVTLPNGPLTLVQILIGVTDLFFCSVAISLLIPAQPPIDFVALSVIFVFATLFGFASHAPGSLGVFDAAMLVGLRQFNREDLVAGLLLFRLLYFIIPFTLALLAVGARELWLATTRAQPIARPQEHS